ncbi:motile sperm domain-containing protein 1-like [Diorhabda carinulata]|uniref:motile sperm domain-containing protein 1-like n=1 Tax=Diorhabda carinulata TaxID=1163345 RepID=UPI0025A23B57|nr:motile sperm domain-containing protein 1-like [Diorhabda carinulata]
MSLNNRKIPVFVFPNCLKFYVGTKSSHKQIMTLYNLYDFTVRFRILSTAPSKYAVTEAEGTIGPHMSVDIIIRHVSPIITNCNITDKFRISMQDNTTKEFIGKRDIEAVLLSGEVENISNDGDFENLPSSDRESSFSDRGGPFSLNRGSFSDRRSTNVSSYDRGSIIDEQNRQITMLNSTNYIVSIIIGAVCVVTLLLPTKEEISKPSSNIPVQFHITITLKLVLSYVLGLVTMVIFRP